MKNSDYISLMPKPLLDAIVRGKAIPFVGAGFSMNCECPNGFSMPDWRKLGEAAANEMVDYSYDGNPLEALSAYEDCYHRTTLVDLIRKKCGDNCVSPGVPHRLLCECFQKLICTTNFDSLIERAFQGLGINPLVIRNEKCLPISTDDETTLIKIHGDFSDPARMVATERDYDLFIDQNPLLCTFVSNLFITRTMLLIGYSFDDCDLRQLLSVIRNRLGSMARPIYCLQVGASKDLVARYKRRGIDVINIPLKRGGTYKSVLTEFLASLKQYKVQETQKLISSTVEESQEQLFLPSESNKLCFVSCASSRMSLLRVTLDRALRNSGLIPLWPDNIQPIDGMSRSNAIEAAIQRANLCVFDITGADKEVLSGMWLSLSRKKDTTLVIADRNTHIISDLDSVAVRRYSLDDDLLDEECLLNEVEGWIRDIDGDRVRTETYSELKEVNRLFDMRAYDATVVAAWTVVESRYRGGEYNIQPRHLFDRICAECKTLKDRDDIRWFKQLRNQVVHGARHAMGKEARRALDLAHKVLQRGNQ